MAEGDVGRETSAEGLADPRAPWEELIEDPNAPRRLLAVMFTDIVGSTELATALGDKRWRELLEMHDAAVRAEIARFGGTEVDTAGDAFFATFELPVRAVDCALEAARSVRRLGLRIRAGVHMGECVVSNGKVRGVTVHIGARVGAKARGDEVLVSSTIRDVLAGAGLKFSDRGEQTLKGVDGRWRLHAVEPRVRDNESDLPPLLEAALKRPPPPAWKQPRVLVAAGVALALLIGAIVFVSQRGPGGLAEVKADSVAVVNPASGAIESAVGVGRFPVGLTVAPDGVWVANSIDRTVSRIGKDGKTVDTIGPVGSAPTAVASGMNLIWVANSDGHSLSRVSGQTRGVVGSRIGAGNGLSSVSFGAGALWISNAIDGNVWKIDPNTGEPEKDPRSKEPRETLVGHGVRDVLATRDAVWAVSETAGTLSRLDPGTAALVKVIRVGNGPRAIAVGAGSVWVANTFDDTVSRIDPRAGKVTATIKVGNSPRALAFAGGLVTVANEADGTLLVIDPKSNKVVRTVRLSNIPMGLVASGDRVYVSVRGGTLRYRGGTLRFASNLELERPRSFDPAFGFNLFNWAVTSAVYDGLLTYKRVSGLEGTEIVPDLAEEILPPTDNGTTYTFTLRPGLKFSDGTPVKASDVRTSFERQFRAEAVGLAFFGVIKGASKCSPQACDLSESIVANDVNRTVTFHLERATPDFVHILALPMASIVPGSTVGKDQRFTPIAGTGPYRFESITPKGGTRVEAVLIRNLNFRARPPAQPDGYANRIVVSWGDEKDDYVKAVRDGTQDLTIDLPPENDEVEPLLSSNPGQVHVFDEQSVLFVTLNPNTKPFNDPRVRQAVNYAIDRRVMADSVGGPLLADPACQILAKDVFGYAPYCPYTKSPNASGTWTGPDMEKARALVEASGTKGQQITVWTHPFSSTKGAGDPFVRTLNALGYRAKLKVVNAKTLFSHVFEPRAYQSILDGWFADYPSASNFILPLLACPATAARLFGHDDASANFGNYCSAASDKAMEDALAKQQANLLESADTWAALDHTLTDTAPWAAYATRRTAAIVSTRIGTVVWNPALRVLLSQMWLTDRK
jgi:peptide/nickel transport system substrate-binding protein